MANNLDNTIDKKTLRRLAWGRSYSRGEDYFETGCVAKLREKGDGVTATVIGSHDYRVRLWIENGELEYECDCPVGEDGAFCKHAVATGLAWLDRKSGGKKKKQPQPTITIDDVREHLRGKKKEELIEIIIDCDDESLQEKLLLEAAGKKAGGDKMAIYHAKIDEIFQPYGFIDYHAARRYAQNVDIVIDSIEKLLKDGHAAEVVELAEHALAAVESALQSVDDSSGYVGMLAERLTEIHLGACVKAKPDPIALAKRLLNWELTSSWDFINAVPEQYGRVLGAKGLTEYRRLAQAEWEKIPQQKPGDDTKERWGRRHRIKSIMESLARQAGDLEELVAVKSRDLSYAYDFLQIAELYSSERKHNKALEWAEKGVQAFPDKTDLRLRTFLAAEYFRRKRHDDGMQMLWLNFEDQPRLSHYAELKKSAERIKRWRQWREKALKLIREGITESKKKARSDKYSRPWTQDHSELVKIFLWEKDEEAAWREAKQGGCDEYLWLELAKAREKAHPQDALEIYQARVAPTLDHTNNEAYREAVGYLKKIKDLMKRCDRQKEFVGYLEGIKAEYRRKRNFMKLIQRVKW